METQSALIRTNGAVELHTVARIDVHLALIVGPRHAEHDHALWLNEALDDLGLLKLRMLIVDIMNRDQHFFHSLQKLRFSGMLPHESFQYLFNFHSSNLVFSLKG